MTADAGTPGQILAAILAGVLDDEQAKIAGGNTARVYNFDVSGLTVPAASRTAPVVENRKC